MQFVKVEICRYVDAHFPGWVECSVVDAGGHAHYFVEKIPALTEANLDQASVLPQPGTFACIVLSRRERDDGREIVLIDTRSSSGIKSTGGRTLFYVFSEQLCELPRDDDVG